jgi:alkylhydroperoxidase/carboxymuconolactone decarboxylase family protein YurZ
MGEKELIDENEGFRQLLTLLGPHPDRLVRLMNLRDEFFVEGALSRKHKFLMALALVIATRCDSSIGYLVGRALDAGASRDEIIEAVGVAVIMGGAPSMLSGLEALAGVSENEARQYARD